MKNKEIVLENRYKKFRDVNNQYTIFDTWTRNKYQPRSKEVIQEVVDILNEQQKTIKELNKENAILLTKIEDLESFAEYIKIIKDWFEEHQESPLRFSLNNNMIIDNLTGKTYGKLNDLCKLLNQVNARADKNAELYWGLKHE